MNTTYASAHVAARTAPSLNDRQASIHRRARMAAEDAIVAANRVLSLTFTTESMDALRDALLVLSSVGWAADGIVDDVAECLVHSAEWPRCVWCGVCAYGTSESDLFVCAGHFEHGGPGSVARILPTDYA